MNKTGSTESLKQSGNKICIKYIYIDFNLVLQETANKNELRFLYL